MQPVHLAQGESRQAARHRLLLLLQLQSGANGLLEGASFILGIFEIIGDIFNDMRRGFLSAFQLLFKIEKVFALLPFCVATYRG